ncbi:Ribonuclease H-like protein [Glarea lozoyensis ATCC 20868]|uniref:Ribonuclease H-like protein n=1 Tax=Glarea lozoyensis (strain ATCC 20868 / MF5171) TaxID=1116229 RepID=S3CHU3_GLAL2|nr:Ribonuclease H-like protein [Glarea lozoyensis ATCC 20868]EPE26047.1 Ribonuclease H-like protein [Glarea lozoyensis ATCC 20868]
MDQSQDFKSLQEKVQENLIATTRTAGQISSEDLGFHRSFNLEVGDALDEQNSRLLALSTKLLKSAASISELRAPVLEDADDVENNWRSVVDVIDSLLEKADTCLDEYTGMIKRKEQPGVDQNSSKGRSSTLGNAFRTQNLVKPQLAFDLKPDNHNATLWKPLLNSKPHAILSLEDSLDTVTDDLEQLSYKHPYETEILQLKYPDFVYQQSDPIPYQPVDGTSATYVDTEEGVLEMLSELKGASEIAIDLEHHDTRTYVGLVSLMQISTREKDWIVDTLKPWRHKLQILNEVFADPKIVKVFHGAFMDVVWLQRDLGLYIVGLFDTHHASRTLGYQGGSLAFLLKKFIDFDADKKYQMADWRIRPLPEEMLYYARADTHYLLYIYDNMRNELVAKSNAAVPEENKIEITLQKSKEVSLLRYERQIYNTESGRGPGGWYSLLVKTPALFNNEQFAVFKAVHEWRDQVARTDDDSTNFVMPNRVIFNIAKVLPNDVVALLSVAHPVSFSVKSRSEELLGVINKAKADGKEGPSMMDILRPDSLGAIAKASIPSLAAKSQIPSEQIVAVVDDNELRTENSTFWGGAFGSSIWDEELLDKTQDLRLAVPLPKLSSEAFGAANGVNPPVPKFDSAPSMATSPVVSRDKLDEPFVLKRGSKRKSEAVENAEEEEEASGEYDISLNDLEENDTGDDGLTKKERKAQRKAEKRAKKEAKAAAKAAQTEESGPEEEEEEPFDYNKAEPVLNAKRKDEKSIGKSKGKRGQPQAPFDPYSKSADAPKGMRRAQTERAGKSHTFRN